MATVFDYQGNIEGFEGDMEDSLGARICGATDNSVFWKLPQAILYPRNASDLKILAQSQHTLTPRGGFTGTNGQSLNDGFIIDTSRYMNQIHWGGSGQKSPPSNPHSDQIDVQVDVQVAPGLTLDEVNQFLAPHGLFFAPHVSPSSRATIGGMFGTDAAGKGSAKYGRMHDHIEGFDWIFPWGDIAHLKVMTFSELGDFLDHQAKSHEGKIDSLNNPWQSLKELILDFINHYDEVIQDWPTHPRGLSGYNLKDAWDPKNAQWSWAAFLAGSEGTLGMATSLLLKATPLPQNKALSLWLFQDLDEYQDVWDTLKHFPSIAVELIDQKILRKATEFWPPCSDQLRSALQQTPYLFLMEFENDSEAWHQLQASVPPHISSELILDESEQQAWWSIRSRGVELLSKTKGSARPIAFAEDTVVDPSQMGSYLKELGLLLDSHQLEYSLFGHADVGCVHMRPFFDLRSEQQVEQMELLQTEIFELVQKYQGTFWGEHGRGLRTQFVEQSFHPLSLEYLKRFKQAFDPTHQWNPHKILPGHEKFEIEAHRLNAIPQELQDRWHGLSHCNGNGACLNHSSLAPMCPSYAVTKDRRQSPKGRALMAREWMRLREQKPSAELPILEDELRESLDTCLSCNACSKDCPLEVNIPAFKHEFNTLSRGRFLASSQKWNWLQAWVWSQSESISASLAKMSWGKYLLRPALQVMNAYHGQMKHWHKLLSIQQSKRESSQQIKSSIQIWLDPITYLFHPQELIKATQILEHLKVNFQLIDTESIGKIAYKEGFSSWVKQRALLEGISNMKTTLVIDPSVCDTLQSDYHLDHYKHFSSWLIQEGYLDSLENVTHEVRQLVPHCHQDADELQQLWNRSSILVEVQKRSCCGQAGDFAWRHPKMSTEIFQRSWQGQHQDTDIICGGSCRLQVMNHRNSAHSEIDLIMENLAIPDI